MEYLRDLGGEFGADKKSTHLEKLINGEQNVVALDPKTLIDDRDDDDSDSKFNCA